MQVVAILFERGDTNINCCQVKGLLGRLRLKREARIFSVMPDQDNTYCDPPDHIALCLYWSNRIAARTASYTRQLIVNCSQFQSSPSVKVHSALAGIRKALAD